MSGLILVSSSSRWTCTETAGKFERSVPSVAEATSGLRKEVVTFARGVGADAEACERVALAVAEALNNVVVHAYRGHGLGPMHVEAWPDEGHLFVCVRD